MKLKSSSLHYKLTNKLIYNDNLDWKLSTGRINLCPYAWAVVFASLLAGIIFPIAAVILTGIALVPFIWWLAGDPSLIIPAIMIGAVEILLLMLYWVNYRQVRFGTFFPRKVSTVAKKVCKKKRDSLLYQLLKSGHDKICPVLEKE